MQFQPSQPTSFKFLLILSSHLRLGLHKNLFVLAILYEFQVSSLRATCSAQFRRLNLFSSLYYAKNTALVAQHYTYNLVHSLDILSLLL